MLWHPLRAGLSAVSSIEGCRFNPMMRLSLKGHYLQSRFTTLHHAGFRQNFDQTASKSNNLALTITKL